MKVHDVAQGSLQWLELRAGKPTASEFKALVTSKWKIRTGEGVRTYLATKLAERWLQGPLPGFSSFAVEQGHLREERAIKWFQAEYGLTVQRPGFITSDDGRIGCSPDGLLEDGTGLEVKSPAPQTHVGYLIEGVVPEEYLVQVHGGMLVTGARLWRFVSYNPAFPALVVPVHRDEAICATIQEALDSFNADLEEAYDMLVRLNDGPPPKREVFKPTDDVDPRTLLFQGLPGEHSEVGNMP